VQLWVKIFGSAGRLGLSPGRSPGGHGRRDPVHAGWLDGIVRFMPVKEW